METEEMLGLSAFIITMAVLTSASVRDWKEREVPDIHWVILGTAGLALFLAYSVYMTGFRWEYVCLAGGTAMILLDILWDRDLNPLLFYPPMALLFIVPLCGNMGEGIFIAWASIPVCFLIYVGMYMLSVVRGGADVKCLIVLSMMFPLYPQFFGMPVIGLPEGMMSQIFVYSVSVLFIAAIMAVPMIFYFMARNVREGGFSRKMFSGYRVDLARAESTNVWPLEDIADGNLVSIKIPNEGDIGNIYQRLREAGREDVWVTPMIPFIVLITLAVLVLTIVGSPLFLIV